MSRTKNRTEDAEREKEIIAFIQNHCISLFKKKKKKNELFYGYASLWNKSNRTIRL